VTCLGNNEPDRKPYLANWNGVSIGCYTKEEAAAKVIQLREAARNEYLDND
jgi:hypothetical protein